MRKLNINKLHKASNLLDTKYGKVGTAARNQLKKEAVAYYYGEILKEKRKELHITQEILAEKIGVKKSDIAKIEKGETDMQLSSFIRIAEALGLKFSLN